ncbi:hypothetical protein AQUCO_04100013v1 [Aquilegia coerulea]|uniref:F-box domain-containing protein n=1 Tax=Aquilegia coerulea TaxID=218851 RepID=A0A2G5CPT0_AQUCA|nr:hypothetical protein AQUCO_04100013v1 [Aquilegia coerulea]
MGALPDEIVIDILLFLPIKSLMRFRCVNKTWLQLLTNPDPQFAQSYLTKSNKKSCTILALGMEKFQDKPNIYSAVELNLACDKSINLELPFSAKSYYVGGIRNGLILLRLADVKNKLFIWNPFTNDYIHIPSPPPPNHSDCCDKITNFGFGFLQHTNQYKVISFSECNYTSFHPISRVSVYTLGTDSSLSWRNLSDISYHTFFFDCAAPLVNGVLHWTAFTGPLCLDSKRIVSFNMKHENFQEIPYPKANYHPNFHDRVGELGGSLCILGRDSGENVELWVMQEYGIANSWTKLFTIGRPDICESFASLLPIGVVHNGEILRMTSILINTITEVFLYYPETNSVRNLKEFGLHLYEAFAYTPSFISPRDIIGGGGLLAVRRAACTYTPSLNISPRPVHRGRELLAIRRAAYKRNKQRRFLAKKEFLICSRFG